MSNIFHKPELLSPAGDPEKLTAAVVYGADAVYLAGTSFGMRAGTGNFNGQELNKSSTRSEYAVEIVNA